MSNTASTSAGTSQQSSSATNDPWADPELLSESDLDKKVGLMLVEDADKRKNEIVAAKNAIRPKPDQKFLKQIKPYFKEWLEILYEDRQGRDGSKEALKTRCVDLQTRLQNKIDEMYQAGLRNELSQRSKDFIKWFNNQIAATRNKFEP